MGETFGHDRNANLVLLGRVHDDRLIGERNRRDANRHESATSASASTFTAPGLSGSPSFLLSRTD
jgi:hypothetical protein